MLEKTIQTLHFAVDEHNKEGNIAYQKLVCQYGSVPIEQADVIVALGGDGFMLHTLHKAMALNIPVFGMNLGSVGFLMNDYNTSPLLKRIEEALSVLAFGMMRAQETPSRTAFHDALLDPKGRAALRDRVVLLQCTTEYPAA
ncbi:MAG: NAD(+)/NADH kinase, partial [Alphaproteobacteria bacterium]|nr:NAD(+)/NADH kinase [Alphaproteobacteria bacterium]